MRSLRRVPSYAAVLGSGLLSALGAAVCHAAPCTIFAPAVSYTAGSAPNGIAVGDFDRDGIADLAIANGSGTTTFSVLRGKGAPGAGDGTFLAAVPYTSSGVTPRAIAAADMDDDGILDLLVGVNNSLQLWKGAANGTFALRSSVGAGSTPRSIAVGDLDADGVLDVAVANSAGNEVRLLHGEGVNGIGSGTLTAWRTIAVGASPVRVLLTDLDGDGILDVVTANNGAGTLSIARGRGTAPRGDGTFAAVTTLSPGGSPFGLACGDFDRDGRTDLVVANSASTVLTEYRGTGGGAFAKRGDFTVPLAPQDLVVGDFDGDGLADLATACAGTNQAVVLPGTGDGGFGAARVFAVAAGPGCVAAGDFKSDGAPDLVTANYSAGSVSRLLGTCPASLPVDLTVTSPNGGEPWWPGTAQVVRWTKSPGIVAVDVDLSRDGGTSWKPLARQVTGTSVTVPALAPTTGDLRVRVRDSLVPARSDRSDAPARICGLLGGAIVSATGLSCGTRVAAADLDGDGVTDAAVANALQAGALRGDGGGGFTPWAVFAADSLRGLRVLAAGGGQDAQLLTLERGALRSRAWSGSAWTSPVVTTLDFAASELLIADADEDGVPDALVAGSDAAGGAWWMLRGLGEGRFGPAARHALPAPGAHLLAADFDADGILDVVVSAGTALQLWRGMGSGGRANGDFALAAERTLPVPPGAMAAADFDGDGALDLAACLPATGDVWRFRGVADEHRFEPPTAFGAGGDPRALAVSDWDGDGATDLAVALGGDAALAVLTGQGAASPTPGAFNAPQSFEAAAGGAAALALGDFDGDGAPDVLALGTDGALTCRLAQCPPIGPVAIGWQQSPVLDSQVFPGDEIPLAWSRGAAVPLVSVDFSRDDGAHWMTVAEGVAANAWPWSVPAAPCAAARLRVRDAVVPSRAAVSARFAIAGGTLSAPGELGTLSLGPAWPSPARGTVTLSLRLPRESRVSARVCDVSGRTLRVIADARLGAGEHLLTWDGGDALGAPAPAGVYFVRVEGGDFRATRRCVRLR